MFELNVYRAKTFIYVFTRASCQTLVSAEASPHSHMLSMLVQRLVTVRWVRMDSVLTGPKLFQYTKRSSW
jgi:hypothetical protein